VAVAVLLPGVAMLVGAPPAPAEDPDRGDVTVVFARGPTVDHTFPAAFEGLARIEGAGGGRPDRADRSSTHEPRLRAELVLAAAALLLATGAAIWFWLLRARTLTGGGLCPRRGRHRRPFGRG
jgi:hypothetical protein